MRRVKKISQYAILLSAPVLVIASLGVKARADNEGKNSAVTNAANLVLRGEKIFRFDTFGDQAFWGDMLRLHQAIEGSQFGGVGPGVSPNAALTVGLKVDVDALPNNLLEQIRRGAVNLNDPAATLALLKANAVVGVTGFFNSNGSLQSVGIQCALCHSTVDNSLPALCPANLQDRNPGTGCVGHRLDGWANRDLNVGAIIAMAPDLSPFANLLNVSTGDGPVGTEQLGPRKIRCRTDP